MRTFITILIITSSLNSFSQFPKHDIKWQAEVIKVSANIYDIRFTIIPSKKWWTSSPIQDTSKCEILPTQIKIHSNQHFQTINKLKEHPIPEKTTELDGEIIKWVKSKTTYTQRIKLITQLPFTCSYSIYFQPRADEYMLIEKEISGQIIYSKNELRVRIE